MASPTLLLDVLCHLCQNLRRQHVCKIGCFVGSVPVLHTFLSRCTARNHAHTRTDKTCTSTPAHTNTHTQRERERERERETCTPVHTHTHRQETCSHRRMHQCFKSRLLPLPLRLKDVPCAHSPCLWSYPKLSVAPR